MKRVTSTVEMKKELIKRDLKDNLEEMFLRRLLKGPVHGYALMTEIEKRYGVNFNASEIYPKLDELEKKGYVISKREYSEDQKPKRVYYSIPFKTVRRLKEIRDIKNFNRRMINIPSAKFLTIQLSEPVVVKT